MTTIQKAVKRPDYRAEKLARTEGKRLRRVEKGFTKGFTLIELLVVITIIAILAGLLFPAMGAVRTQARKTSAKNDAVQIVNAVKAFYLEYGRYPALTGAKLNEALIKELTGGSASDLPDINKRQIRFLEIPKAKNGRGGIIDSATDTASVGDAANGEWADPWGNTYRIAIDDNYDGTTTPPTGVTYKSPDGSAVDTGVLVVSKGKADAAGAFPDLVLSWK